MKKKEQKEKFAGISLRLSPVAKKQLDELMREWGENRSRCVCRAVAEAHMRLLASRENIKG